MNLCFRKLKFSARCISGPGKVPWNEKTVAELGDTILNSLPPGSREYVLEHWEGGDLIKLPDELSRPGEKEIAFNRAWVKPVVKMYPTAVTLLHEVLRDVDHVRLARFVFHHVPHASHSGTKLVFPGGYVLVHG